MAGRWMTLCESAKHVANQVGGEPAAISEILACLRRGDLQATAEHLQNFFVWHRKPFNGIEGRYRAEKNADRRMIPIGADWWEVCEPDFVASTAHVRWSKVDADRIGNSQPFQSLVTNVLLRTDDVERLWPAGKTKGVPKRPVGTGLQDADAPLIDQMRAYMIEKNLRTATRAANALFNRGVDIPGDGEPKNKITRLVKRYKAKFG